jgi:hypothetical protein
VNKIKEYWPMIVALASAGFVAAQSAGADGWDWAPDGTRTGMALAAALTIWIVANGPAGSGWRYAKAGAALVIGVGGTFIVVYADHVLTAPDGWALAAAAAVAVGLLPSPPTAMAFAAPALPSGARAHLVQDAGYRVP